MKTLPIIDSQQGGPSCVTIAGGLSAEQVLVAERMKALKDEMRALRSELVDADELRRRRDELRGRWRELVRERDDAWRRKMHALGHEV